jgi:PII-like signaling protein
MRIEGPALLVRIYLGEADKSEGRNLYHAIVELFRERGIAGATVLRGTDGFGAKQHRHTTRILSLSLDLPVVVEAIDTEEKVRAILPDLDRMVGDGLIVVHAVEVVTHRSDGAPT